MGFWTIGPVLGSLMVSVVATLTLPTFKAWQSQFTICGIVCLGAFVLAFFFLRELEPGMRDQVMVSERDRALIEARAVAAERAAQRTGIIAGFAQLMRPEIVVSAFGVSVLLLFYYTGGGLRTIYLVTVFHLSIAAANAIGNWAWASNALALIVAGIASDRCACASLHAGGWDRRRDLHGRLSRAGRRSVELLVARRLDLRPVDLRRPSPTRPGWRASPRRWRR